MKEHFKDFNFHAKTQAMIEQANTIIEDYQAQGFTLTLRQLYYQFVSRALIENTEKSYKNLGGIISDARLAGLIDWDAIEDRTRALRYNTHWKNPAEIANYCKHWFYLDRWKDQDYRIEVWVEKEALAGIAEKACSPLDVPYFCCKGYTSQSEMYLAGQRLNRYIEDGKEVVIIHLGDHDPSGIDMSRDIQDRLDMFTRSEMIDFTRIALNFEQVKAFNPPPNPAKMTDSRFKDYRRKFGVKSWELDAIEPAKLVKLIQEKIEEYRDDDRWDETLAVEAKGKKQLAEMADQL